MNSRALTGRGESRCSEHLRRLILRDCDTVLDVGCGVDAALLSKVPGIPYSVGVDLELPVEASSSGDARERHSDYRRLDIRTLSKHFEPGGFDCVVALDVIEHLPMDEGHELLTAMERIATKRVIVYTPNGFVPQPPAPGNPHQKHLSGWTVEDFEKRGYTVIGVNGWRPLRGPYSAIRWHPTRFWGRVSLYSEGLVEARPRLAFQLLCVKEF